MGPAVSALEVGDPAFGARTGSQLVCRREIVPALSRGVEVIDEIFACRFAPSSPPGLGETATVEARVAVTWARRHDACYEVQRVFCGSHLPRAVPARGGSRNGMTVAMASSSVRAFGRRERPASAT